MSIARHELCQWIENGIQCDEIALNDRRWCNEHLGDAYKWIAKSHCIIKKKDELRINALISLPNLILL